MASVFSRLDGHPANDRRINVKRISSFIYIVKYRSKPLNTGVVMLANSKTE